jgi:hypothetical protein
MCLYVEDRGGNHATASAHLNVVKFCDYTDCEGPNEKPCFCGKDDGQGGSYISGTGDFYCKLERTTDQVGPHGVTVDRYVAYTFDDKESCENYE